MLPPAAEDHYRTQATLVEQTSQIASTLWKRVDYRSLDATYPATEMFTAVAVGQLAAAAEAERYLTDVLTQTSQSGAQDGRVVPAAFVGASDGRDLGALLYEPVVATKVAVAQGASKQTAMRTGLATLLRIAGTQVQDAGRSAVGTGIVARPHVGGWVRVLSLPSCSRCAVLAGRWFLWNQGFQRHPLCDCRHIPSSENIAGHFTSDPRKAVESGQVRGLSEADRRAIVDDGADVARVVNAQRGMQTIETAQRKLKVTLEGVKRRSGTIRLRPETIYEQANSRDDAIRLLKRYGYLI